MYNVNKLSVLIPVFLISATLKAAGGEGNALDMCDFVTGGIAEVFARSFPKLSDEAALLGVKDLFTEAQWLMLKAAGSAEFVADSIPKDSVSMNHYGEYSEEYDRTMLGVLALKWILNGERERFPNLKAGDPRFESGDPFLEIQKFAQRVLPTPIHVSAEIADQVIHDLGKVKSFARLGEIYHIGTQVSHDTVIIKVIDGNDRHAPSLVRLLPKYEDLYKTVLDNLRSEYNIAQFNQAESNPNEIDALRGLKPETLEFKVLHTLFDIMGVLAKVSMSKSLTASNDLIHGFLQVSDAFSRLSAGASNEQVYIHLLTARSRDWEMPLSDPVNFAVVRLSMMMRVFSREQADLVKRAYLSLESGLQKRVTRRLGEMRFKLEYSPATLLNGINPKDFGGTVQKAVAVAVRSFDLAFESAAQGIDAKSSTVNIAVFADLAKFHPDYLSNLRLVPDTGEEPVDWQEVKNSSRDRMPKLRYTVRIFGQNAEVLPLSEGLD